MEAMHVELQFYGPEFQENMSAYRLSEEQANYTAMPMEAIAACRQEEERDPVVIVWNGSPAGFFVLHGWEGAKEYTENRQALLLRSYSVQTAYQGRGIAKQSLEMLPAFIQKHYPGKQEIVLSVNEKNVAAQALYRKAGFVDTGKRVMGRKGLLFIFRMNL